MAAKKRKSPSSEDVVETVEATAVAAPADAPREDVAGRFIGQWNRLVSTTNWEKGRIICQWREALELSGAGVTEYSDEAWSQLVGGVTSQHVGRLRRVYQRFGAVLDQYEGLYWSHFQAALDWNDAEMWLEGAILQNWSVSQMRGKRWETLGSVGDPPQEEQTSEAELDDDASTNDGEAASAAVSPAKPAEPKPSHNESAAEESNESSDEDDAPFDEHVTAASPAKARKPLAVDVDDLPSDLADAFEQFKLAIITQRRLRWSETTPDAVIECLDALKQLALAPADD